MKKYIAIGILIALQSGKRYSAKELSLKFETSIKTIYRSIDTLLAAGMPITSIQGKNGGYELLKESNMNSSFFTTQELSSFISFLKSNAEKYCMNFSIEDRLSCICDNSLIEKLKNQSKQVVIDTGLWGHNEKNKEKAEQFKKYISNQTKLELAYINSSGSIEKRVIHPYTLVYKTNSWYIYAFCEMKNSFRLFKLSRIKNFTPLHQTFKQQNINPLLKPWNIDYKNNFEKIDVELLCSPLSLCDIEDWLDSPKTKQTSNGSKILVSGKAYFSLGLIHKIMEYGNKIEILKPQKLKNAICNECLSLYNLYNKKVQIKQNSA